MKKLGKLSINVDKIMKNEELVNLKGGYPGYGTCTCYNQYTYCCYGYVAVDDGNQCYTACETLYGEDAAGGLGNLYEICQGIC